MISENAETLLRKRYYMPGEDWSGLCRRVARYISHGSSYEEPYYNAIFNLKMMPNSPTLMNASNDINENVGNLSACFVLGLDDSMESIFETAKKMSLIFKAGGGVGIDFSNLREKNAKVGNTAGVSSGVISFMQLYNTTADIVKQAGRRRAALMGSLRVDHPEIIDFINAKSNSKTLNNFNISIAVTDKFMQAVKNDDYYDLVSPVNGVVGRLRALDVFKQIAQNAHKNGDPGLLFVDTANAKNPVPQFGELNTTNPCFAGSAKLLTESGYKTFAELSGKHFRAINSHLEPQDCTVFESGFKETITLVFSNYETITCTKDHVFLDINNEKILAKDSLNKQLLRPLIEPYDITYYIYNNVIPFLDIYPSKHTTPYVVSIINNTLKERVYDFSMSGNIHWGIVNGCIAHNCGEIYLAPNESCNLISLNINNINSQNELQYYTRLATHFANDLIDIGQYPLPEIRENTLKSRKIGIGIMGFADYLAKNNIPYDSEYGRKTGSKLMDMINYWANIESMNIAKERNQFIETKDGVKRMNGTLTCIAPTGSISMICDVSPSLEPYFALSYTKNVLDGKTFKYTNNILTNKLQSLGLWNKDIEKEINKTGSIQHIDCIPDYIKKIFKVANEISFKDHVLMQAAFQEHVENSISKTINLPNDATIQDVMDAYMLAYDTSCKGITVYRDSSRAGQVLTTNKSKTIKCPDCGKDLDHTEGCLTCRHCGWSGCQI